MKLPIALFFHVDPVEECLIGLVLNSLLALIAKLFKYI